jgi:hypothetical protein
MKMDPNRIDLYQYPKAAPVPHKRNPWRGLAEAAGHEWRMERRKKPRKQIDVTGF